MPKISVVVPVYRVEKYLNRCVDSILNQTFSDFELILVDDGSPDNSGKICDEYALKDNRVVVIHKENGGLSSARNSGLEVASGKYVTFIDSDDWVHNRYLEIMYNAINDNGVSVSMCRYRSTDKFEIKESVKTDFKVMSPSDIWLKERTTSTIACCKLFDLKFFKDLRFPIGRKHEDEFTTYKVLFECEKIVFIDECLYYYFRNPESIIHSKWTEKRFYDCLTALKEQNAFFKEKNFTKIYEFNEIFILDVISRILYMTPKKTSENKVLRKKVKKERKAIEKECKKQHIKIPYSSVYAGCIKGDLSEWTFFQKTKYALLSIRDKRLFKK